VLSLLKETKLVRELRGARFKLSRADAGRAELEAAARQFEEQGERDRAKLERMMLYGQSAACRWRLLHEYFAAPFAEGRCGNCDNCLHPLEEQLGLSEAQSKPEPLPVAPPPPAKVEGAREFVAGETVSVPTHGEGRVVRVEGDKLVVAFPDGEPKLFKAEFVELAGGARKRRGRK
jgi:ATP-dependent DNA helicase RecQ